MVAVLAVAAWARLARFRDAFPSGEAVPLDGDCAYHLHRTLEALAHFPRVPTFDPLMNWPRGGHAPWADGFDVLGAAFAWAAGGTRSEAVAVAAAMLWPVVLGLVVVWATMDLARALVPPGEWAVPLAAGLVVAVVPQAVVSAAFGRNDHHVLEALSALLLAGWAVRRFPGGGEEGQRGWGWEAWGAGASGTALWFFSGGALYVAIASVPLLAAALAARTPPRLVGSGAPGLLGGALLGALLSVPAAAGHGRLFSFMFPSLLQPVLVGLSGVAVGVVVGAGHRFGRLHRGRRLLGSVAVVLAVAGLAAAVPSLRGQVGAGLRDWLFHRDPWLAGIQEFQPLWAATAPGGGGLRSADFLFGSTGLLSAAALAVAVWAAWRVGAGRALAFGWTAAVLFGLTLLQIRFGRVAAPFGAVAIALALGAAARLGGRVLPWPRAAAALPLLAAVALILGDPRLRHFLAVRGPAPLPAVPHAALAMRLAGPAVPGHGDGVLVPWDLAHTVGVLSGRPVVANGFGSYLDRDSFEAVASAIAGDERLLVETMDRYDLGFLLAGVEISLRYQAQPPGVPLFAGDPLVLNPAFMVEAPLAALIVAGSGLPGPGVRHLRHLMPVFASPGIHRLASFPLPLAWTYERVAGAELAGRAAPGTRVVAEIPLVEWGRPHRYRAWTDAVADGTWRMRVALPSGFWRPTLHSGPAWTVDVGEAGSVQMQVPEAAVREGRRIEVPAPRAPRGTAAPAPRTTSPTAPRGAATAVAVP